MEGDHIGGLSTDQEVGRGAVPNPRIAARLGIRRTMVIKTVAPKTAPSDG